MKTGKSLAKAICDVYGVTRRSDYERFVPPGGANQMMRDTWARIGTRLLDAIESIEDSGHVEKQEEADSREPA